MDSAVWTTQSTQAEHSRYSQTMILVYDMVCVPRYDASVPLAPPFTPIAFLVLIICASYFSRLHSCDEDRQA